MTYEANWQSLNTRPVPQWFGDAKFGVFVHWGLYSIPAYARVGDYAEWYGYSCNGDHQDNDSHRDTYAHHLKYYGNRPYYDFVNEFTGNRFDPDRYAELFQKSGAKYINFVSKHHDGYCLYATRYAPGLNSVECAPKRDFLAELRAAMEGTGVRFGVYHSLYEWNHPLYLADPEAYALKHLIPMLIELVENYRPATLFTDGEWEQTSKTWHSEAFLQWLYNESPVRDFIVPNDRWGSETRGHVGGNFTTEYGFVENDTRPDDWKPDRPFEECRGIGRSFGLNKEEGADDYLTLHELLALLCSLVSEGGNLLLNIGPDGDGTIPPIMEERLLGIGRWLAVNGDAIYSSHIYAPNKQDGVWYTARDGRIYAMTTTFPTRPTVFSALPFDSVHEVRLLGCDAPVTVRSAGGAAELFAANCVPTDFPEGGIYVYEVR